MGVAVNGTSVSLHVNRVFLLVACGFLLEQHFTSWGPALLLTETSCVRLYRAFVEKLTHVQTAPAVQSEHE